MGKRDIKFRVWDTESKCYRAGDWCLRVESGLVTGKYGEEYPEFIVEQYTGLKDKNGKEIYEGDILEGYKCHFEVKFENGAFMWGDDFLGYIIESDYDANHEIIPDGAETLEIIGNIYETPELLSHGKEV